MSTDQRHGTCPQCESPFAAARLFVETETATDGYLFAECPDCELVVTPP